MPRWPKKAEPAEPLTDEEKLAKIHAIVTDPEVRRVRYRREMVDRIRRVIADEEDPSVIVEAPSDEEPTAGEAVEVDNADEEAAPDEAATEGTGEASRKW